MFHLFWEAKGQYAITYVALLIPVSLMGYERAVASFDIGKNRIEHPYVKVKWCVAAMFLALIIGGEC